MTRERLPTDRTGLTHKGTILARNEEDELHPVTLFITANTYTDGRLAEIFIVCDKEGSTINGLLDCISTETSMLLQEGVPLQKLVEKFIHTRFAPAGYTQGDTPVRYAKSLVDYIFRWLGATFLSIPAEIDTTPYVDG